MARKDTGTQSHQEMPRRSHFSTLAVYQGGGGLPPKILGPLMILPIGCHYRIKVLVAQIARDLYTDKTVSTCCLVHPTNSHNVFPVPVSALMTTQHP